MTVPRTGSTRDTSSPTTTSTAGRSRPRRGWTRETVENLVLGILRPVIIALLLLITVFPFYYMLILSIRPLDAVVQDPGALWVPFRELTLDSYKAVLLPVDDGGQGFLTFMRNSLLISVATVLATLLVAIPGSYAVSRLKFFGHRKVSALFLAVYFFPSVLLAIPLFVFFTRIGLRGSLVGLVIVYVAQTVPVSIYLLRNYFNTVPVSLEEAGMLDGAGRLRVMWHISLPLAMPSIVSNALYIFMIAWNEFLFALLFLVERPTNWTVSLGLSQLAGSLEVPTTVLMAGAVILTLPIVVIFFASERLLTGGLTAGAEKG